MARRALLAVAVAAVVAVPTPSLSASGLATDADVATPLGARVATVPLQDPDRPKPARFVAADAGIEITPPAGWVRSPASALNPPSDPPEPVPAVALRRRRRRGPTSPRS